MNKLPLHKASPPKIVDKLSRGFNKLPVVELIRPWQAFPVGYRFKPPGGLREVLMQKQYIKMAELKQPVQIPVDAEPKKVLKKKRTIKPVVKKDSDE